ncbi:uncharacterized protein RHOBADRAFT_53423 [Rhodotorula graminis WP1]|uniref:C3H1-type domain-containing protein n=1 Tax=Rhodotorula graminis (strain WP1) TaxID=578459 RepID=A0A194S3Y7_RHOGW|nr:uncharacterized protein RHOBADRAFT_53423 [Rhodotorula graminis WP1]KPV75448.1 hypothetical protein RHOBADRAFT_53423 [Rhodotorula graminis WP1]
MQTAPPHAHSPHPASRSVGAPPPLASHLDHAAKKAAKAKDLSHVPCKFFKANSCTAGKACPFSHDVGTPGVSKPVCQWFAKGNCKFGHKCALAHVLPGQPLSWDRKNKRAAQQALRDAQATADSTGLVTATHATAQSSRPNGGDTNGLVQTLRQSVDIGNGNGGAAARAGEYARYQHAAQQQYAANGAGNPEAVFGSPGSSVGQRLSPASPPLQHRSIPPQHLQHDAPHAPLSFATLAHGPTAAFVAPSPSGLSHHFGGTSPNGRSSVAAHAMLSEQARRLSSTSESLSPPRMPQHLSHTRVSFTGGTSPGPPPSPPLAVPVAQAGAGGGGGGGGPSIFGTSPFSGSRGLFIPSSYDSNEDGSGGFPRSPPVRASMLGDHLQRPSSGMMTLGAPWQDAVAVVDDESGTGDDANAEEFDEGFLPSSLNELLTDEEFTRRTRRAANHAGPSSLSSTSPMPQSFDPFLNSKSVPAELLLAAGKPSLASPPSAVLLPHPSIGARSASHTAATSFGLLSSSVEGHNPSATPYQPGPPGGPSNGGAGRGSLLAQSRTREATVVLDSSTGTPPPVATPPTSSLLGAALSGYPPASASAASGIYSASYSDTAGFHHRPSSFAAAAAAGGAGSGSAAGAVSVAGHPLPPRYPQTGLSPGTNASLALPGSSLPGGLAAGLSRLHLVPPSHTGETPPSSSYAAAAASPPGSGSGAGSFGRRATSSSFVGSPLAQHESALRLGVPGSIGRAGAGGGSGAATPEPQSAATERPPRGQGLARGLGGASGNGAGSAEGSAEEDDGLEGGEVEDIQFEMEVA